MTETKKLRNGFVRPISSASSKSSQSPSASLIPHQQNHSRKTAYLFGKDDLAEVSNDNEEIEMTRVHHRKPRGRKRSSKNDKERDITIVEEPVQEGDTLRTFALRYNCQVSDIKRLNCLYNDRDFFALKAAKIPIKAHSILSQESELDKRRQQKPKQFSNESTNSTTEDDIGLRGVYHSDSCDADESSDNDLNTAEVRLISLKSGMKAKHNTETLLDVLDNNLQRLRDSVPSTKSSLDEVTYALTQKKIHPLVIPDEHQISLKVKLLLILLVIGVIVTGIVIFMRLNKK